jgi:hypothetical protein
MFLVVYSARDGVRDADSDLTAVLSFMAADQ